MAGVTLGQQSGLLGSAERLATQVFVRAGVLPWFLIFSIIIFTFATETFLTGQNFMLVARQATYLVMVAMGQMVVLLTAGLDLSVGVMFAIASVVSSMVMVDVFNASGKEAVWGSIIAGCAAGMASGLLVGAINGIGVAFFRVPPFIMTLAMSTIVFGIALTITGGTPIYGMPDEFASVFGYGSAIGVPVPIWITIGFVVLVYVLLSWTRTGRYFYALGGNLKASMLSGISTRYYLFMAYVVCAAITTVAALMLTARLESGESNIGRDYPLNSIAACAIGGVSLFGGTGRLLNVVLGSIFIILVQNGMNLMRIGSYQQMIVIGILLVLAVIADNYRQKMLLTLKD
ncbi:MAG: ABC transporter permease [Alphaproteobacteria bacterium]|nr:ABC transporter permease [Alphaproteobacteria bacterium]